MSKALLYDATLCIGCKMCEKACAEHNGLAYSDSIAAESKTSEHKFTAVLTESDHFMRKLCMHCEEPACASACPVGAFHKTALGPVVYDVWKCLGCRYCMVACAFAVPKYEWSSLNPRVRKCIMCPDLVKRGEPTACAAICPTGATKFGERDALLEEAQQRIDQNPVSYVPHIYGKDEVGGTSVFLLSAVPFEQFGYPSLDKIGSKPLPDYTGVVMNRVPDFIPLWAVILGGIYWLANRKNEVAEAEALNRQRGVA